MPPLTDCNESLRLDPNIAATRDSRGFTYLRMKNLDAAIADYDAAIALNANQADSLYGRGLAKRDKGDKSSAQQDIDAAIAIDNGIVERFKKYGVS